ncbi:hypothetical protein PIB30_044077 [Stylosanthes scabra]|uniref:Uncharacterized protein n=1 Tax=Stylosanthes scabra TaxID=79078 RepID=A0ABU6XEV9_9FABA|nr:hypothetical protein [Stylosanthes scabra]
MSLSATKFAHPITTPPTTRSSDKPLFSTFFGSNHTKLRFNKPIVAAQRRSSSAASTSSSPVVAVSSDVVKEKKLKSASNLT